MSCLLLTLNGGELSLGLALKSNDNMISTSRCGLSTTGYGELSTTYLEWRRTITGPGTKVK